MSYILDALKKSEQQRGQGKIPDVQTIHSSSLNYRQNQNRLWPSILIIAVLLNLVAILYFIYSKENSADSSTAQDTQPPITTTTSEAVTQPAVTSPKAFVPERISAGTVNPGTVKPGTIKLGSSNTETVAPATSYDDAQSAAEKTDTLKKMDSMTANRTSVAPTTQSRPELQQNETGKTQKAITTTDASDNVLEYHELDAATRDELPAIIITAHVYSSNPLQRSIVINNNFMEEGEYVIDDLILQEITPDGAIFDYQGTRFHYGVVSGWQ